MNIGVGAMATARTRVERGDALSYRDWRINGDGTGSVIIIQSLRCST
jgi:hypothetical protein